MSTNRYMQIRQEPTSSELRNPMHQHILRQRRASNGVRVPLWTQDCCHGRSTLPVDAKPAAMHLQAMAPHTPKSLLTYNKIPLSFRRSHAPAALRGQALGRICAALRPTFPACGCAANVWHECTCPVVLRPVIALCGYTGIAAAMCRPVPGLAYLALSNGCTGGQRRFLAALSKKEVV